jgi:hypothetical protein
MNKTRVIIEAGPKRTFASALDWSGWSRSGRGEEAALEALAAYHARYAEALRSEVPEAAFDVVERLRGDASTDMGVPAATAAIDAEPLSDAELERQLRILEACWSAFDRTAEHAAGHGLRPGARGGGRDLEKIRRHVIEADGAYLTAVAGSGRGSERKEFVEALCFW